MGYPVSKGNSIQFEAGGEKLAFAVILDDFTSQYSFGLFRQANGEWQCPVFGGENGFLDPSLTSQEVMAYGSVAHFIRAQFGPMTEKLKRYLGASIPKPDHANKPECVGYDLALDVDFDPVSLEFYLNKEPPLSHVR